MRAPSACFAISLVLVSAQLLSASALFNFESDAPGTATPFTDTVSGVSATFSSSDPAGFSVNAVSNIGALKTLQGQALSEPGPLGLDNLPLTIRFNQLIASLSLNFAVNSTSPVPLHYVLWQNGGIAGQGDAADAISSGYSFPEGLLNVNGPAFDTLVLTTTAPDFAIDNVLVNSIPEPATGFLALFAVALLPLTGRLKAFTRRLRFSFFTPISLLTFVLCAAAALPATAAVTIDTSNSNAWTISNGTLTVQWLPGNGRIFSIHWSAFPDQELIDQTNQDSHGPKGFYMDNAGLGSGTPTNDYYLDPYGNFVDWWVTFPSNSSNAFTWSQHYVLFANDPGIHIYFVLQHGAGDIAGSVGQIQWVFRGDLNQFNTTYSVNTGLGNLGATKVPLPDAVLFGTGIVPGRNVQDATVDLHGLPLPDGFRREFYTKYDYSSYEYLHRGQGVFGSTMAAWMMVPSSESLTGGPTKQDLIFTGNLLIMEAYSNHLDNQMRFAVPADAPLNRLYGPFYLHFNAFSSDHPNAASLYREALDSTKQFRSLYDSEPVLLQNGYVPSNARGQLLSFVQGTEFHRLNQAWVVLGDNQTNFQYSHAGREYWKNADLVGLASFDHVVPGTYRLSAYVLGEWGELRADDVNIAEHQPNFLPLKFTPENFGSAPPVWTIGTPDRSSHEFLHGQVVNPVDLNSDYVDRYTTELGNSTQDDREYWGNWNYWQDFAATGGAVNYFATAVGSTPATNDLSKWNYNQWHIFNPGLYAGVYDPSDTTTDGYKYVCPSYVGDCTTTPIPDWQVHFTTTSNQQSQGQYVVLSVGLAATEANLTVSLNGTPLAWPGYNLKNADAAARSGLSGTYQWIAFQWDSTLLNPPGMDNVLTFHVDRTQGVMYDALRMEITNRSAAHEFTGWNDYEYLYGSTYEPANDSVSNNGQF